MSRQYGSVVEVSIGITIQLKFSAVNLENKYNLEFFFITTGQTFSISTIHRFF